MAHDIALDFRRADARARVLTRLDELVGDLDHVPAARPVAEAANAANRSLETTGYVALSAVTDDATCERLVTLVDRMLAAGLPAVFVFVTETAFALGRELERSVSKLVGRPYALIEDLWAWRIPRGASGWPPHRGVTERLDRAAPGLVNTWVALSPTDANRSCMHFVPLDADPHYPNALDRVDFDPAAVRPAPLRPGEALAWNANILHWGGRCAPDADGPRVSCSFSLEPAPVDAERGRIHELDRAERLDVVLAQIATYGEGQPDVSPSLLDWARASCAFRTHLKDVTRGPLTRKEG